MYACTATRVSEAKVLYFDLYLFFPHSKFVSCPSPHLLTSLDVMHVVYLFIYVFVVYVTKLSVALTA
jgi:hypothetical protein